MSNVYNNQRWQSANNHSPADITVVCAVIVVDQKGEDAIYPHLCFYDGRMWWTIDTIYDRSVPVVKFLPVYGAATYPVIEHGIGGGIKKFLHSGSDK